MFEKPPRDRVPLHELYLHSLNYWQSRLPTPPRPDDALRDEDKERIFLARGDVQVLANPEEKLALAKALRDIARQWMHPIGEKPMWQEAFQEMLPILEAHHEDLLNMFETLRSVTHLLHLVEH